MPGTHLGIKPAQHGGISACCGSRGAEMLSTPVMWNPPYCSHYLIWEVFHLASFTVGFSAISLRCGWNGPASSNVLRAANGGMDQHLIPTAREGSSCEELHMENLLIHYAVIFAMNFHVASHQRLSFLPSSYLDIMAAPAPSNSILVSCLFFFPSSFFSFLSLWAAEKKGKVMRELNYPFLIFPYDWQPGCVTSTTRFLFAYGLSKNIVCWYYRSMWDCVKCFLESCLP